MNVYETENRLLNEIEKLTDKESKDKIVKELHSTHNVYDFDTYISKLNDVKSIILNQTRDADLILQVIKLNTGLIY